MDAIKVSKALADPLRWEILKRIVAQKEDNLNDNQGLCVCQVVEEMNLIQSKVSYHVKELKEAGLIREETRGRWNFYYLKQDTLLAYLDYLHKELLP